MHPHAELIERFYQAFQARDHATMAACYHAEATFHDEVFTNLAGSQIGAMWQMLCERGTDLAVEFRDVEADDATGRAHWEATYTFSSTGRKVRNRVDALFLFRDGLILVHRDCFSFWDWAGQALGPKGRVLGWSGAVKNRVRFQAEKALEAFQVGS